MAKLTTFVTWVLVGFVSVLLLAPAMAGTDILATAPVPTTVTGELTPSSDTLEDGSYVEVYPFDGEVGQWLRIDLVSDAFDAYLILVDPEGDFLATNDDGGEGVNARLAVNLPSTGTYEIWVNTFSPGEVGPYTLTWQAASAEDLSEADRLQRADSLAQQGNALTEQGRYGEAEPLLLEALAIRQEILGDRGQEVAASLNDLGLFYRLQGRYREAAELYRQALAIVEAAVGDRHPSFATLLNNLGVVYDSQGRYDNAESLYLQAQEIWRETLGDRHPNVAQNLTNLGWLYYSQGRYGEAEPLLLEAIVIRREVEGDQSPGLALSLNNLALVYSDLQRDQEAEALYVETLAIWRALWGNDHPDVATTLNNLAALYHYQGRYDEAVDLYRQALEIYQALWGNNHPDVANTFNNLAVLYFTQRNYPEAERLYQQSLQLWRSQLGDHHPLVDISLSNLALLQAVQGNIPETLRYLEAALEIQEWNLSLNLAALADEQRQDYSVSFTNTTDWVLSLHLNQAPRDATAEALALTTLLRRKGRLLDAGTDNLQALRRTLEPADAALLEQLDTTRQTLATLTFNRPDHLTPEAYQTELAQLENQANQLEGELARRSAAFRAETQPVEIAAIQARIPQNGALVEYVRYRPHDPYAQTYLAPHYAAYVLLPDGQVEAVDLGPATAIDDAINAFSEALRRADQSPTAAARALAAWIVDPLTPYLADRDHLLISPDSELNRIPFEALQTEDGRYWVEAHQISYLNSGRDLLKLNLTAPSQRPAVIVANPDYDAAAATATTAPWAADSPRRNIAGGVTDLAQFRVGPLPGTALEAAAIAPLLPDAQVLTETDATENALKAVQSPQILHIATHGFFLGDSASASDSHAERGIGVVAAAPQVGQTTPASRSITVENPLLRSGLALAGFNPRSSGDEDGVLTALEAASLNLVGTQLVVLSACDTGRGDIANGEGVYGLRRAFTLAGAEAQVLSLWQVDDYGTQSLMTQYYQALLQDQGRAAALRQVQLQMLQSGGRYADPYYWAAFILTGDWRSL
jgi:CHAT domain-containing protein